MIRLGRSDWHEAVVDKVLGVDRVVTRYIATGTHQGRFAGSTPTGRRIEIEEISIYRVENGRVAEQWCLADDLLLLRRLSGD